MSKTVLAILIDGLRYDFISEETTPYLSSLANEGIRGELVPPLTFSFHPIWFAGLYPQESGYWLSPVYSPHSSPWRFLPSVVAIDDKLPRFRKLCNMLIAKLFGVKENIALETPLRLARYFDYPEKKLPWDPSYLPHHVTLFDILRKKHLKWLFIGSPTHDVRTRSVYDEFKRKISKAFSFIWLHFGEVDWFGHEFGPSSHEVMIKLNKIDTVISKIIKISESIFEELNILVFGDHGMVSIQKVVNINNLLKHSGLKLYKDYIYFLGATTARFWFKNQKARKIIEEILGSIRDGVILSDYQQRTLKCKFKHKKFGELIFVARPHVIFYPNFFNSKVPRGMHGYLPDVKENHAALILSGSYIDVKPQTRIWSSVSLFSMILNMLGFKELTNW